MWCADDALKQLRQSGLKIDQRLVSTLEAKRLWLAGKKGDKQLSVARDGALDVVKEFDRISIRDTGWEAAKAVAKAALGDTAWTVAKDTAWRHARVTARDERWMPTKLDEWAIAEDTQNHELDTMLHALDPHSLKNRNFLVNLIARLLRLK